jgi:hypothetical protein
VFSGVSSQPENAFLDANNDFDKGPVAYEFDLKQIGYVTTNSSIDALNPTNYTSDRIYEGSMTMTELKAYHDEYFDDEDYFAEEGKRIVVQKQSMVRLNRPDKAINEGSFTYATTWMPLTSISLEVFQDLDKNNFPLDPYFIWYDLKLDFKGVTPIFDSGVNTDLGGVFINVSIFNKHNIKVLKRVASWNNWQVDDPCSDTGSSILKFVWYKKKGDPTRDPTKDDDKPWCDTENWEPIVDQYAPSAPYPYYPPNNSLDILDSHNDETNIFSLVIANPLYAKHLGIPSDFMRQMSPLIGKVEES